MTVFPYLTMHNTLLYFYGVSSTIWSGHKSGLHTNIYPFMLMQAQTLQCKKKIHQHIVLWPKNGSVENRNFYIHLCLPGTLFLCLMWEQSKCKCKQNVCKAWSVCHLLGKKNTVIAILRLLLLLLQWKLLAFTLALTLHHKCTSHN